MNLMIPKINPIRDRDYLDWLRTQPCILTGKRGDDIDPAHIGTLGKGIKSGDDEALPMANEYHRMAHDKGEMSIFRAFLPREILRDALRAYAREQYREWKRGQCVIGGALCANWDKIENG